jgi:ankyrin repeat protein
MPADATCNPLLIEFINAAVADPPRARDLVRTPPGILDLRTPLLGETALHWLAVENFHTAVALLLELGADVNVTNEFRYSPLKEARIAKATQTAEILERAGARLSARDIEQEAFFASLRQPPAP